MRTSRSKIVQKFPSNKPVLSIEVPKIRESFKILCGMIENKTSFKDIRPLFPRSQKLKTFKSLVNYNDPDTLLTPVLKNYQGEELILMLQLLKDCGIYATFDVLKTLIVELKREEDQHTTETIKRIIFGIPGDGGLLWGLSCDQGIKFLKIMIELGLMNDIQELVRRKNIEELIFQHGSQLIDVAYDCNDSRNNKGFKLIELLLSKGALVTEKVLKSAIGKPELESLVISSFSQNNICRYVHSKFISQFLLNYIFAGKIKVSDKVLEYLRRGDKDRQSKDPQFVIDYAYLTESVIVLKESTNQNYQKAYTFIKACFPKIAESFSTIEKIAKMTLCITEIEDFWPQFLEIIIRQDNLIIADRLKVIEEFKLQPYTKKYFEYAIKRNVSVEREQDRIIFLNLIEMQAPLELIYRIISHSYTELCENYICLPIFKNILTEKNSKYILKIINSFPLIQDNNGSYTEILYNQYKKNEDKEFRNDISEMLTRINPCNFSDQIYNLERISVLFSWYAWRLNVYIHSLITEEISKIIKLSKELENIILEYIPEINAITLLIDALMSNYKLYKNSSFYPNPFRLEYAESKVLFYHISLPLQPEDSGYCGHYALFNALLPALILNGDHHIIPDIFTKNRYKSENQQNLIDYFLLQTASFNQQDEDISPAVMLTALEDEDMPLQPTLAASVTYNQAPTITMVPIYSQSDEIGHADCVFELKMIANLVILFFLRQAEFPIMTSFLLFKDDEHWLNLFWLNDEKNVFDVCLIMNSVSEKYNIPKIFGSLQKMLFDCYKLKKKTSKILQDSYRQFELGKDHFTLDPTKINQILALLQCWHVLLNHHTLQDLVDNDRLEKIKSALSSNKSDSKQIGKCQEIIKKIGFIQECTTKKFKNQHDDSKMNFKLTPC